MRPRQAGAAFPPEHSEAAAAPLETDSELKVRLSRWTLRWRRDSSSQYSLGFGGRPAAPLMGRLQVALSRARKDDVKQTCWHRAGSGPRMHSYGLETCQSPVFITASDFAEAAKLLVFVFD